MKMENIFHLSEEHILHLTLRTLITNTTTLVQIDFGWDTVFKNTSVDTDTIFIRPE